MEVRLLRPFSSLLPLWFSWLLWCCRAEEEAKEAALLAEAVEEEEEPFLCCPVFSSTVPPKSHRTVASTGCRLSVLTPGGKGVGGARG